MGYKEKLNHEKVKKLVFESQQGNMDSLDALFKMFYPFRHGLAAKFSNKGISNQDVFQQTDYFFVTCVLDYDEELSTEPILHITTKTRSLMLGYYRKELLYLKRHSFYGPPAAVEELLTNVEEAVTNLKAFSETQSIPFEDTIFEDDLEVLTDAEMEVYELYVKQDLTQNQVAEALGCSRERVRDLFGKIKIKLRNKEYM